MEDDARQGKNMNKTWSREKQMATYKATETIGSLSILFFCHVVLSKLHLSVSAIQILCGFSCLFCATSSLFLQNKKGKGFLFL